MTTTDVRTADDAGAVSADPSSAVVSRTPREVWDAVRLPLLVVTPLVIVATVLALLQGGIRGGVLDPEAARQLGGKALAVLLRDRGVDVTRVVVPSSRAAAGTTTFVPISGFLPPDTDIASLIPGPGHDVVLVAPGVQLLDALRREPGGPDVRLVGDADVDTRSPRCTARFAVVAGRATSGGELYTSPGGTGCYLVGGAASVLVVPHRGGELRVVGSPDAMTNDEVDEQGNAALALGLLSGQPRVEWVYPRNHELAALGRDRSVLDLLPDPVVLAAVQLGVAAAWLGVWRARRLGPVVVEPLPVVVRATETVEGRAGLYQSAQARDPAAEALRGAVRRRLTRALGLGAVPDRRSLCTAVAERTARDAAALDELLYGRTPADDAALVRLADDLDSLDSEVRSL